MVVKLFNEIGPMFKERNGGYTRILKMGYRVGDNAPMAYVELVQKTTDNKPAAEAKEELKLNTFLVSMIFSRVRKLRTFVLGGTNGKQG